MLVFYRCVDQNQEPEALGYLEQALSGSGNLGRPIRQWCFLEAACSSALLRHSPAAARTWLERGMRLRKPPSRYSIDAAIAQSEGRYRDAIEIVGCFPGVSGQKEVRFGIDAIRQSQNRRVSAPVLRSSANQISAGFRARLTDRRSGA
jgi:hypothetical protein